MTATVAANRMLRDRLPLPIGIVLLAAAYYAAGRFGFALADPERHPAVFWPAAGVALAALIVFGRRLWPGIFLGVVALNAGTLLDSWASILGIALGNSLEALVGATLLHVIGEKRFDRPIEVALFVIVGVFGCTLVGPTIAVASLLADGVAKPELGMRLWWAWWLGDAAGVVVVTPMLLMAAFGGPRWTILLHRRGFWITIAVLAASVSIAFLGTASGAGGVLLLLPSFPVLVWTAMQFGTRGAAGAAGITVMIATIGTVLGRGPFATADPEEATRLLWAYSMLIGITGLALATVVDQRDQAAYRQRLQQKEQLRVEKEKLLLLERERITREMHDGLGGQLVSLLSVVERGVGTRREVAEGLRRALDDIRIVIDSLDPDTTDLPISLGKLRARLEPLLRRNGMEVSWKIEDDPRLALFTAESVLHVLRIIQEAVTNVMRHARASRVEVAVVASPDGLLSVSIRDDGCGLDPVRATHGRGIHSMQTRARELGAELQLGNANPGTRIVFGVPIPSGSPS